MVGCRRYMASPLIGITTSRNQNSQGLPMITCMESYILSVTTAGGIPLLIPLGLKEDRLDEILERVDGVLFSGGGDIHPAVFGGKDHPEISQVDEDRDRVEIELYRNIIRQGIPFLGICRGLQVINAASGGTLYTHIADQHPNALEHYNYPILPYTHLSHSVQVEKNSKLRAITEQTELRVNSLHHQGIDRLADGFTATAFAPDGIIEAIEKNGHPYGLAVQWHPEWLLDHPPMLALFQSFIKAVKRQVKGKREMDG
jgi:putative glutamine amidotransferase